jgi:sulfur carrier protein
MTEVFINKEIFQVAPPGMLSGVLLLLKIERPDGIAIAVNEQVIPKNEWETYPLQAQDKVFVIRATQGG